MKEQISGTDVKQYTGELERLGPNGTDVMVLGIEAEGFEDLSSDQRKLI